jgi:hypothetical protein
MKVAVVWVVASCSLAGVYRRFRGCFRAIAPIKEAESTSKTSANFYQTTLPYSPDDSQPQILLKKGIIMHGTSCVLKFLETGVKICNGYAICN